MCGLGLGFLSIKLGGQILKNHTKFCVSFAAGKTLAIRYGCKYIETSPGINHNVDELLVGMLAQIELKEEAAEKGQLSRDATQCCREMNDSEAIFSIYHW